MFFFFMKEIKVLVNQYGALIFLCVRLMSIYSVSTEKNLQNTHALAT